MAKRAVARRRVAGRGRSLVAIALLVFVAVSTIVIWRRSFGIAQAGELRALAEQQRQLRAEIARLERDIRYASTRGQLVPLAEQKLGMHVPPDSEVIYLVRPGSEEPSSEGAAPLIGGAP